MKTQHTQGPWNFEKWFIGEKRECVFSLIANNTQIAKLVVGDDENPYTIGGHEALANAKLIGAAPELLDMLYLALPSVEESDEFNEPTRKLGPKIRALLKKIEGEL